MVDQRFYLASLPPAVLPDPYHCNHLHRTSIPSSSTLQSFLVAAATLRTNLKAMSSHHVC